MSTPKPTIPDHLHLSNVRIENNRSPDLWVCCGGFGDGPDWADRHCQLHEHGVSVVYPTPKGRDWRRKHIATMVEGVRRWLVELGPVRVFLAGNSDGGRWLHRIAASLLEEWGIQISLIVHWSAPWANFVAPGVRCLGVLGDADPITPMRVQTHAAVAAYEDFGRLLQVPGRHRWNPAVNSDLLAAAEALLNPWLAI